VPECFEVQEMWKVSTDIPTIIDPSATINYPSATGSIIVGIPVMCVILAVRVCAHLLCVCVKRVHIKI
jgi:hypothetical protein